MFFEQPATPRSIAAVQLHSGVCLFPVCCAIVSLLVLVKVHMDPNCLYHATPVGGSIPIGIPSKNFTSIQHRAVISQHPRSFMVHPDRVLNGSESIIF